VRVSPTSVVSISVVYFSTGLKNPSKLKFRERL
jgi:hypothetical protein